MNNCVEKGRMLQNRKSEAAFSQTTKSSSKLD
jgi:hypothetical protein